MLSLRTAKNLINLVMMELLIDDVLKNHLKQLKHLKVLSSQFISIAIA
jgi:hypothetical protein